MRQSSHSGFAPGKWAKIGSGKERNDAQGEDRHKGASSIRHALGQGVEEARYEGEYHVPCIQLLEFEDGSTSVRFCYYSHAGRFQRSPLMVGQETSAGLRDALSETPRLRSLLREIVG